MNSHDMHRRRNRPPANIRSLLMNEVLANVELPYRVHTFLRARVHVKIASGCQRSAKSR